MFVLVAEQILVPVSDTSVIRVSWFALCHNYLCICSSGRNLGFLWQEHGLMEMNYGGGSHRLPSICEQSSISVGIIG
jgi:hypothetical protein